MTTGALKIVQGEAKFEDSVGAITLEATPDVMYSCSVAESSIDAGTKSVLEVR